MPRRPRSGSRTTPPPSQGLARARAARRTHQGWRLSGKRASTAGDPSSVRLARRRSIHASLARRVESCSYKTRRYAVAARSHRDEGGPCSGVLRRCVVCVALDGGRTNAGSPALAREAHAGGRRKGLCVRGSFRCLGSPLAARRALQVAHVRAASPRGFKLRPDAALAKIPAAIARGASGSCHVLAVPRATDRSVRGSAAQSALTPGKGRVALAVEHPLLDRTARRSNRRLRGLTVRWVRN
jgi:hypothetical protein